LRMVAGGFRPPVFRTPLHLQSGIFGSATPGSAETGFDIIQPGIDWVGSKCGQATSRHYSPAGGTATGELWTDSYL
jgi:hypothetical protein